MGLMDKRSWYVLMVVFMVVVLEHEKIGLFLAGTFCSVRDNSPVCLSFPVFSVDLQLSYSSFPQYF